MAVLVSHQGEPLFPWTWMAKQARKWFLGCLCRAKHLAVLVGPFQLRTLHVKHPNHTTPKLCSGCNPKCYDFQSIYSLLPKMEPKNQSRFLPYLHLRPKLFLKVFLWDFKVTDAKLHCGIRKRAAGIVSPLWFLQQMFLPWHGGLCAKLHEDPPSFKSCWKAAVVGPPLPWDWPLPCLLDPGSIPQGHGQQGWVSRLPFQSKSQKSKSLCSINKIPALFRTLVAQFTGRVDSFPLAWARVSYSDEGRPKNVD